MPDRDLLRILLKNPQQGRQIGVMMGQVAWVTVLRLRQQILQVPLEHLLELLGRPERLEVRTVPRLVRAEIHVANDTEGVWRALLESTHADGLSEESIPAIVGTVVPDRGKARCHHLLPVAEDNLSELVSDLAFGLHVLPFSVPASLRKVAFPSLRSMR